MKRKKKDFTFTYQLSEDGRGSEYIALSYFQLKARSKHNDPLNSIRCSPLSQPAALTGVANLATPLTTIAESSAYK